MARKQAKSRKPASNTPVQPTADSKKQKGKAGSKKARGDYDSLRDPLDRELALLGLRVKQITADGNCFFRALSDQLEGHECGHSSLRCRVVALMKERQEEFAPFVEDDQTFEAYIARMKKEGTWAGHMELQAASLLLQVNIAVYQAGQPRWAIVNFPPGTRQLHLSYHDGEHYNSVRRADDYSSTGPPAAIGDNDVQHAPHAAQLAQCWSAADESVVAAGTGCHNAALIQQQLAAAGGDVEAAIEAVIEILAAEQPPGDQEGTDVGVGKDSSSSSSSAQQRGNYAAAAADETAVTDLQQSLSEAAAAAQLDSTSNTQQQQQQQQAEGQVQQSSAAAAAATAATAEGGTGEVTGSSSSSTVQQCSNVTPTTAAAAGSHMKGVKLKSSSKLKHKQGHAAAGSSSSDKRPSRNKPCPCGSGRKHKNCCELKGSSSSSGNKTAAAAGLPVQLATLHI